MLEKGTAFRGEPPPLFPARIAQQQLQGLFGAMHRGDAR